MFADRGLPNSEFQQYEESQGKVENHEIAKDLLAGFAGEGACFRWRRKLPS